PGTVMDITHESLIRQWGMLRDQWLPEETKSGKTFLDLVDRARNRRLRGGSLLTGLDLTDALKWNEQHNPNPTWAKHYADEKALADVAEFIAESQREERKRIRRTKRNLWIAVAASVVFAILAGIAVRADKDAKRAHSQAYWELSREEQIANHHLEAVEWAAEAIAEDPSGELRWPILQYVGTILGNAKPIWVVPNPEPLHGAAFSNDKRHVLT